MGDNRRQGGCAAADQVPVFWSLGFNWTPVYIHVQLTTCVFSFDLRKIGPSETSLFRKSGSVCA